MILSLLNFTAITLSAPNFFTSSTGTLSKIPPSKNILSSKWHGSNTTEKLELALIAFPISIFSIYLGISSCFLDVKIYSFSSTTFVAVITNGKFISFIYFIPLSLAILLYISSIGLPLLKPSNFNCLLNKTLFKIIEFEFFPIKLSDSSSKSLYISFEENPYTY